MARFRAANDNLRLVVEESEVDACLGVLFRTLLPAHTARIYLVAFDGRNYDAAIAQCADPRAVLLITNPEVPRKVERAFRILDYGDELVARGPDHHPNKEEWRKIGEDCIAAAHSAG